MLILNNICIKYNEKLVISRLTFTLKKGEIGVLLGQSGCGKSTTLKSISGLIKIHSGQIRLDHQLIADDQYHMPTENRDVGMIFQDYALFPHLTVSQNICFGLFKENNTYQQKRLKFLLDLLNLENLSNAYPFELSGGQKQRVALARALAPKPKLLLMDEPFSGLDARLRDEISISVGDVLKSEGVSTLMVTHDQKEAFALADKLGVIHQGHLIQWDEPYQLYHQPKNYLVANFIGECVFLPATYLGLGRCRCILGEFSGAKDQHLKPNESVLMMLRPDDIVFSDQGEHQGIVLRKVFRGPSILYHLGISDDLYLLAIFKSHDNIPVGSRLSFNLNIEHLILFDLK